MATLIIMRGPVEAGGRETSALHFYKDGFFYGSIHQGSFYEIVGEDVWRKIRDDLEYSGESKIEITYAGER